MGRGKKDSYGTKPVGDGIFMAKGTVYGPPMVPLGMGCN